MLKPITRMLPGTLQPVRGLAVMFFVVASFLFLSARLSGQDARPSGAELVRALNQKLSEAKAASDAGQFEKAIEVLHAAIALDAGRDLIWARLGDAQSKLAAQDAAQATVMYEKSAENYKKAISLLENTNPKSPVLGAYSNNLGQVFGKLHRYDAELTAFSQAADLDPANAKNYYFNMGATVHNANLNQPAPAEFNKIAFRLILKAYADNAASGFAAIRGAQIGEVRAWKATLALPGTKDDCIISGYGKAFVSCTLDHAPGKSQLITYQNRITAGIKEVFPDWKVVAGAPESGASQKFVGPTADIEAEVRGDAKKGYDLSVMVLAQ